MANYNWPASSASVTIAAVGTNGAAAPTSSIEVGGIDGNGNLQAIKVGTDGTQFVSLGTGTSAISGHVIVDSGTISSIASGTVTINGTPAVAVASGTLGLVSSLASGTVTISGTPAVAISGTIPITGAVTITSGTVTLVGAPAISGTVAVSGTVPVTISSGTISSIASGTVTISGTPAISGTVNAKAATPTAGTITEGAITVGTAAVQATVTGSAPSATRSVLIITPDAASTAKFYIGSSAVTPTSTHRGAQIVGGQPFVANNDAGAYYICSDTAAQTVYIVEQA